MINEILFDELKEYLTTEYMGLSDKKDKITQEKIKLEVEREKEENPLFDKKNILDIKRMFSPLSDDIFNSANKEDKKSNEISMKINELENNVNNIDFNMETIKKYISFVQILESSWKNYLDEKDKEERKLDSELEEENEEESILRVSEDVKEMIITTVEFLEEQYPEIDFILDMGDEIYINSSDINANLIRVLTYTVSSTIESMDLDTVKVDLKKRRDNMILTLQMINKEEIVGQYIHKYILK